ncbi:MAG: hypothetical protein ABEJ55_06965 [Halanaeroarchaeum sp.]
MATNSTSENTDSSPEVSDEEHMVLAALPFDGPAFVQSLGRILKVLLSAFLTLMILYWGISYGTGVQWFSF